MPGMLGRQPRTFKPQIPFAALLGTQATLPPIPDRTNHRDAVKNWGMMLNDLLGCCTAAAKFHLLQEWTAHARHHQVTEPDKKVLELYMNFGYRPRDPSFPQSNDTDQGAVMQEVNRFIVEHGMPIESVDGRTVHQLIGTAEVDHHNHDHIMRSIYISGGCDIGFEVPGYIMSQRAKLWDYQPGQQANIEGGHDVCLVDYERRPNGEPKIYYAVSWGEVYEVTPAFLDRFLDESYMLASRSWLDNTGHTPSNLTKQQFIDILSQRW